MRKDLQVMDNELTWFSYLLQLEADESAVVFPSWLGSAVCVQRSERE